MKPEELARTRFPVGEMTKDQVRAVAEAAGLGTASKPESQDICFVSGTVRDFLRTQGMTPRAGVVRRANGEVIGHHDGIHQFTVGQRRGLRIGGSPESLYVLQLDRETNEVVVGSKEALERDSFDVADLSWVSPRVVAQFRDGGLGEPLQCIAQLRHRHPGVAVTVTAAEGGEVHVAFQKEWTTVTPGQACVFYDSANEEVLGGGVVKSFITPRTPLI
jgi:tRNA-specific 2-thiouridylase